MLVTVQEPVKGRPVWVQPAHGQHGPQPRGAAGAQLFAQCYARSCDHGCCGLAASAWQSLHEIG